MLIRAVATPDAPAAIGPYSQAVRAGNLLFCSGQIPLRPDGVMVEGGIEEQTRQVMTNLEAVVLAGGGRFSQVVKTTIYLTSMEDFAQVNEIYAASFTSVPPARATVAVAALPRGARVEIDAIVALDMD
jgi:2-iminobutanoate/2-iminopropanoate deaminase